MKSVQASSESIDRRKFLTTAGAAVLATAAAASPVRARAASSPVRAASSRHRPAVAIVGLGRRGRSMALQQMAPYVDIVALCDVDRRKTGPVAEALQAATGRKVEVVQDYRRLLERKDIDVIANATPTHWHARIVIDACRAGKDVYTEKPLAVTVEEGQLMRRVVAETGRIVQVGTQQRSALQFQVACDLIRNGRIGSLERVGVIVPCNNFAHAGPAVPEAVPSELDWDMWSGPAPLRAFSPARLRATDWWDYDGGLVTDWGAHHMDIAHWAMGDAAAGTVRLEAEGYCPNLGKPDCPDQFRPFAAHFIHADGPEVYFRSTRPEPTTEPTRAAMAAVERICARMPAEIREETRPGVLFVGSRGRIFVGREHVDAPGIGELDQLPLVEKPHLRWIASLHAHTQDFVECVHARRQPRSRVEEQHRTQLPCHLTNIALRLRRPLVWEGAKETFIGDAEANRLLGRSPRAPWQLA